MILLILVFAVGHLQHLDFNCRQDEVSIKRTMPFIFCATVLILCIIALVQQNAASVFLFHNAIYIL
jgi:uncharacterized membrane protein YwaF